MKFHESYFWRSYSWKRKFRYYFLSTQKQMKHIYFMNSMKHLQYFIMMGPNCRHLNTYTCTFIRITNFACAFRHSINPIKTDRCVFFHGVYLSVDSGHIRWIELVFPRIEVWVFRVIRHVCRYERMCFPNFPAVDRKWRNVPDSNYSAWSFPHGKPESVRFFTTNSTEWHHWKILFSDRTP